MVIAITGLSGTGKSTVAKAISELKNIPLVVSYTSRPKRPNEKHGEDYFFCTDKEYEIMKDENKLLCNQEFHVATGEIWKYGISKHQLKDDCILVTTPKNVSELKEKNFKVLDIQITVNDEVRMSRIKHRNDNQTNDEILRRDREDKIEFKRYFPMFKVDNSYGLDRTISKIMIKIKRGV